jgi:hypothetical protein
MMQGSFAEQFKTETRSQKKESRIQYTAEMQRAQRKTENELQLKKESIFLLFEIFADSAFLRWETISDT